MFDNLVTYHVHKHAPLSANDALAYQYVLAGNGVFVRAETRFFTALLPVTACTVRGLPPLRAQFQLLVTRIPARLLDAVLTDPRRARRPNNGLNEVLYQFHHHGRTVEVKKPAQEATPTSVATSVTTAVADADTIICDLHSYGNMRAFFSQTDNADGQGARLCGVIGQLEPDPNAQAPSCAEMALAETQSLMVSRMAATIAAQNTAVFVLQRQIQHMATAVTLEPPAARSRLITVSTLKPFQP